MKVHQTEVVFGLLVSPEHPFGCFLMDAYDTSSPMLLPSMIIRIRSDKTDPPPPLLLLLLLLAPPRAIPLFLLGLFRSQLIIFRILNGILFIKKMSCQCVKPLWSKLLCLTVLSMVRLHDNLSCFPSTGSTALKTEGVPLAFLDLDCRPRWRRVCPTWWPCSGCGGVYWCLWWQCQISLALAASEGAHQRIWNIGVHSIPKQ